MSSVLALWSPGLDTNCPFSKPLDFSIYLSESIYRSPSITLTLKWYSSTVSSSLTNDTHTRLVSGEILQPTSLPVLYGLNLPFMYPAHSQRIFSIKDFQPIKFKHRPSIILTDTHYNTFSLSPPQVDVYLTLLYSKTFRERIQCARVYKRVEFPLNLLLLLLRYLLIVLQGLRDDSK